MGFSFRKAIGLVVGFATTVTASAAPLNLWLEPQVQNATVGQTVTIDVFANTSGAVPLELSDAYLAITWDSGVLTNATPAVLAEPLPWITSYWAPGSPLNTNLQDGDARRELLGDLPPNFPIAPVGVMRDPLNKIKVTTFSFTVDVLAPPTFVRLWGSYGGTTTNFYKGNFQIGQWDLAFESGAYSEAQINVVPEPATMFGIGTGALAWIARRKRKPM